MLLKFRQLLRTLFVLFVYGIGESLPAREVDDFHHFTISGASGKSMYFALDTPRKPNWKSDVNEEPGEPGKEPARAAAGDDDARGRSLDSHHGVHVSASELRKPRLALEPLMGRNVRVAMNEWRIAGSRT